VPDERLARYAELALRVGCNLQPGQGGIRVRRAGRRAALAGGRVRQSPRRARSCRSLGSSPRASRRAARGARGSADSTWCSTSCSATRTPASHLAYGSASANAVEGAEELENDQLRERGVNASSVHTTSWSADRRSRSTGWTRAAPHTAPAREPLAARL